MEVTVMPSRRPGKLVPFLLLVASATASHASDFGYELSTGVGESDNIRRAAEGTRNETVGSVGGALTWIEKRRHLDGNVAADLAYQEYFNNTYDSEVIGNVLADFRAELVENHVFWVLRENFGQARINPLDPVTPNNRENINRFSTGPNFALGLGEATRLLVAARFTKLSHEINPFDSDRYSALAGLERELGSSSRISLNVQGQKVEFANSTINQDYDRTEAYLRYTGLGNRTSLAVELGGGRLGRDGEDATTGGLARLDVTRRISTASRARLSAGHQFSDAGDIFLLMQELGGADLDTQGSLPTTGPFTSNYVTVAWDFQRRRTGLSLSATGFKEAYEDFTSLDRTRLQGSLQLQRRLTGSVDTSLLLAYIKENYENIVGDSRQMDTSLVIRWSLSRTLSLSAQADRSKRHSQLPNSGYTENRLWLRLAFGRQLPQRSPELPDPSDELSSF